MGLADICLPDLSFPIRHEADLVAALQHPERDAARDHIIQRARALALTKLLPDEWAEEASMESTSATDAAEAMTDLAAAGLTREEAEEAAAGVIDLAAAVGVALADEEVGEVDEEASDLPTWEAELAYIGMPTSDGRVLMELTNRELPLSLMCQTVTADGHDGAEVCGKLTNIWQEDRPDLGEGVVAVMGSGEFSSAAAGPEAHQLVEEKTLRHVSVDIAPTRKVLLNADDMSEVTEEDFDMDKYMNDEYLLGIDGEIMGATLCAFSAFAGATIRLIDQAEDEAIVASGGEAVTRKVVVASAGTPIRLVPRSLTASAAGLAPIAPPTDWFFQPEPEGKFPLTVMDDGRVMGHLATWDQCHHGFLNECVLARPSRSGYKFFHVGQVVTEDGDRVDVGRIIVGASFDSGHAPLDMNAVETARYYDKTSCVGAFVRAVDGEYGIWLSGVVRSDCPEELVRDMMANPPSGDWRWNDGGLEMIAALSVPVPGFPVPRHEFALTASADSVQTKTLISTGYYEPEAPTLTRAEIRRREMLLTKARNILNKEPEAA